MEYLDMSFSEPELKGTPKDQLTVLLALIDAGLDTKEPVNLEELAGQQTKPDQEYLGNIMKSNYDGQDKAIISALLLRYPKLDSDNLEKKEFKQHVQNMLQTNNLKEGTLKKLIEVIVLKKSDGEEKKAPKEQEEQTQEPADQPAEGQEQDQGGGDSGAEETNNSNMNSQEDSFYANWEAELEEDLDLTEKDFEDMLSGSDEEIDLYAETYEGPDGWDGARSRNSHLGTSQEIKDWQVSREKYRKKFPSVSKKYSAADSVIEFLVRKEVEYSEMGERSHLESSEFTKHKRSGKEKALEFMHDKLGIKPVKDRSYATIGHMARTPNVPVGKLQVAAGDDIIDLKPTKNKKGHHEFKTDVRGNLVMSKYEENND